MFIYFIIRKHSEFPPIAYEMLQNPGKAVICLVPTKEHINMLFSILSIEKLDIFFFFCYLALLIHTLGFTVDE